MAEIRCPMCGKPNPDAQEVCQFCEARLKPLIAPDSSGGDPGDLDSENELPEWLISGGEDPQENEERPQFGDDADAEEWLDRIRSESDLGSEPSFDEDEDETQGMDQESVDQDDDWLQRIRDLHQTDQDNHPADLDERVEDEPSSDEELPSAQDEEKGDLPDWLRFEEGESASDDILEPVPDGESEADELPDWLTGEFDEALPKAETGSEEPVLPPTPSEDMPDWLSDPALTIEPEDADSSRDFDEGHDQKFTEPSETDESGSTRMPSEEGEAVPDWLSDLGTGEDVEDQVAEEDEEPVSSRLSEQELPEWVSDEAETPAETAAEDAEAFQEWFSELGEEEIPADQQILEEEVPQFTDQDIPKGEQVPEEEDVQPAGEEIPGWLKNLGSVVTGTIEDDISSEVSDQTVSPFTDLEAIEDDLLDVEGLPEWLTPERDESELVDSTADSGLTPAELPGWLDAMRPMEGETPGELPEDGPIESAGPLAGLRNVLPSEPDITQFKKPQVYSAKLRVTESQKQQAKIFQKMLAEEGVAEDIPPPALVSSHNVLRWLIAFVLIGVVGFIVVTGGQNIPLPGVADVPAATFAASRIINTISDKAPILLAFDYEPGTSGEMHAAAAALVDHMMLRGARLTLVSTLPTGPGVAEYFVQNVQSQHDYASGTQYLNLGYIPGGAAGLLSFVQTPKWVFPLSYEGLEPWETPVLADVNALSDFAVLVVITDNPDNARSWVEQVQPRIGDTPLLMVVSAQAEPLVQPYFGNGSDTQVEGIVSGISGGAAYEIAVGKSNLGRSYWAAFSMGLIIVVAVVILGGVTSMIQLLLSRGNAKGERVER